MKKPKRELKHWDAYFVQLLEKWLPQYNLIVLKKFSLGKMPLQADAIVIKKTDAEPLWEKHPLWKYLNEFNIVEFKSVSDPYKEYSLGKLITYGFAYQAKEKLGTESNLSLWLILPTITPTLRKSIEIQNESIIEISQGFYKTKAYFPLYIIEYEELPRKEEYYGLKLFAKQGKGEIIKEVLEWDGDERLWKEYLLIISIFYMKILKEVEKMLSQKQLKKEYSELLDRIVNTMGEDFLIDKVGEDKIINKLGKDKIINKLGKEEIIKTLGKEDIIKYLEKHGMRVIDNK